MTARDVMSQPEVTLGPNERMDVAARTLARCQCDSVPVVDATGQLVGLVSDRDVIHAVLPQALDYLADLSFVPESLAPETAHFAAVAALPVASAVDREHLETVAPEDPLAEVMRALVRSQKGCVPVVNDGRLVGVITAKAMLQRLISGDQSRSGL